MAPSRVRSLFACSLAFCAAIAFAYPNIASLESFAELRADDEHPLDLFHPERLTEASPFENQFFELAVNATEFDGAGFDWVTVNWRRAIFPSAKDILALYAIYDGEWWTKAPIKSIYASEAETHERGGYGSLNVRMLNHRTDVQFLFLRDFLGKPRILGRSPVLKLVRKDYPHSVHLALTDQPNEMRVQWVSASNRASYVKWGTVSGDLSHSETAVDTTYTPDDLCGSPATSSGYINPGFMLSAVLAGLTPGMTYYYSVGNEVGGFSEEHTFKGPPHKGTVKILALGDMGQYNIDYFDNPHGREDSLGTSRNMNLEEDVDLVFHVGDISYAMGYVADWDVFFDQQLPLISRVPYMAVMGNHERIYPNTGDRYDVGRDSGGECGVPYEKRLQMPVKQTDKPWYSMNFGPIHFTALSAEHPFEAGTEQYAFLETDLAAVDRKATPWLIVCVHRPMYAGITRDFGPRGYWFVSQELQESLSDLFLTHKVDMIWSGHHHSYHRTCPVHREKCTEGAPVQMLFGNAGAHRYPNLVKKSFIEYQGLHFGYVRFVVSETQLTAEAVQNLDHTVVDSVTLYKDVTLPVT